MTTIMQLDPRPRGTVMGRQVTGPLLAEAQHFRKCLACGGYCDMRDRVWLEQHLQPLPHPAIDRAQ